MSTALEVRNLSKRYGRKWALRDCTMELPTGRVAALVGPNGAGKTTLLLLAVGLLEPSAGDICVFGSDPRKYARETLPRVGFLAQDHPLYKHFTVAELLTMGCKLNPRWDNFDVVRITPLAYMTFALALGIAAGALLRTIVPAMIMTLIGYPLVRTLITKLARPY